MHDRISNLKNIIESLTQYHEPKYLELIIVNDLLDQEGDILELLLTNSTQYFARVKLLRYSSGKSYAFLSNKAFDESRGELILFVNPNLILTEGWLDYLIQDISSSDILAAIGPVSNFGTDSQTIKADYTSLNELNDFVRNRIVSKEDWQIKYTTALDSYCVMIKRDIFLFVGKFNLKYTLQQHCFYDLSLKILKSGLNLGVSEKVYLHRHVDYTTEQFVHTHASEINYNNQILNEFWSTTLNYENLPSINYNNLIDQNAKEILEFNCEYGERLLQLKNTRKCTVTGIPYNKKQHDIASKHLDYAISPQDINSLNGKYFHAIILDNTLHDHNDSKILLKRSINLLKPYNGCIYASINNAQHYKQFNYLFNGQRKMIDRQKVANPITTYTLSEIIDLFQESNLKINRIYPVINAINKQDIELFSDLIQTLSKHGKHENKLPFEQILNIHRFVVIASS